MITYIYICMCACLQARLVYGELRRGRELIVTSSSLHILFHIAPLDGAHPDWYHTNHNANNPD